MQRIGLPVSVGISRHAGCADDDTVGRATFAGRCAVQPMPRVAITTRSVFMRGTMAHAIADTTPTPHDTSATVLHSCQLPLRQVRETAWRSR